MFKKDKGFTLIELLAVIVILGIILTIVVTNVVKYIGDAKKGAFIDEEKKIARQVTNQIALKDLGQTDEVTCNTTSDCKKIYDINDNNYEMRVIEYSGSYFLHLIGKGNYSKVKLSSSDCSSNLSCNNSSIMDAVKSDSTYSNSSDIEKAVKNVTIDNILSSIKEKIITTESITYISNIVGISSFLGDEYKYMDNELKINFQKNQIKCPENESYTGILVSLRGYNYKDTIVNYKGFNIYFENLNDYCVNNNTVSFCIYESNGQKNFLKPKC